jgi:AraC family transcriptional regulator
MEIVRFQDATTAFDEAASQVLALDRFDLQVVSVLLFSSADQPGPISNELGQPRARVRHALERLALAGYTQVLHGRHGLTPHAREWVHTIWGPLAEESQYLFRAVPLAQLKRLHRTLAQMRAVQETHTRRVRSLLEVPPLGRRANRLRGGLSPAAQRRVQLYVDANLTDALRVDDLARRAGLSAFHFARAFKSSLGLTPRVFVEQRRIDRAKALLRDSTLPLAHIATEVGLGTQSRFTTTFRRATGVTPARYRRGSR